MSPDETVRATPPSTRGVASFSMEAMDRLIAAIDRSGRKHNWIATAAGMTPGKFSKIYRRRQAPTIFDYIAIVRAIGVDPAVLFTDGELAVSLKHVREALAGVEQ